MELENQDLCTSDFDLLRTKKLLFRVERVDVSKKNGLIGGGAFRAFGVRVDNGNQVVVYFSGALTSQRLPKVGGLLRADGVWRVEDGSTEQVSAYQASSFYVPCE